MPLLDDSEFAMLGEWELQFRLSLTLTCLFVVAPAAVPDGKADAPEVQADFCAGTRARRRDHSAIAWIREILLKGAIEAFTVRRIPEVLEHSRTLELTLSVQRLPPASPPTRARGRAATRRSLVARAFSERRPVAHGQRGNLEEV